MTTPAGLTPEAYGVALDTAGKPVGGALAAIAKATGRCSYRASGAAAGA
jgi:hypothetical protein